MTAGLGLGGWLGFRLVEDGDRAREQARRDARDFALRAAGALGPRLTSAAVLDQTPQTARFETSAARDGTSPELQIPSELEWLDEPEPFDGRARLDPLTGEALRRLEGSRAEDKASQLAALADRPGLDPAARSWLRTVIAWHAHRADDPKLRDMQLDAIDAAKAPLEVLASALRLRARTTTDLPRDLDAVIGRLPERLAERLFADLDDPPRTRWRAAHERATARRALLRRVREQLPSLPASGRVVRRVTADGELLLFDPARRFGALLDAGETARLASVELGTPVVPATDPAAADAVRALDGMLALPVPTTEAGGFAPWREAGLLAVLCLLLVGGATLAWRGVRSELRGLRSQAEFLTTVTHELKTPLAGIRLTAELLADEHIEGQAERREWLRRLDGEAARLGMLVENVLDLGRNERGETAFAPRPTSLADWLDETLALVEPLFERDGLALERDYDASRLPVLDVDAAALRQALLNLLDNARKYGRGGERVTVQAFVEAETVRLVVRDFGPGIPQADRDRIFDRFERGSAHRSGQVPGVGLGLYLAHSLVARHAGTLRLRPTETGACFELSLPTTAPRAP